MIKSIVFDFNGVILNTSTCAVNPEIIDLIQDLYDLEFNLYLFSNTSRAVIKWLDSKSPFIKYFDQIILAEDTGYSKPSDKAFKHLLQLVDGGEEEIVYIDDGRDNLRQAEKYGMTALLFTSADRLRISLASLDTLD